MEIKDNNDRLNNIMKETDDLKLSIETSQNITDDKLKDTENSIDKIKGTFKVLEYLQKTKTSKMSFFLAQSFAIGLKQVFLTKIMI